MKMIKTLMAASAAIALVGTAQAVQNQGLTISDGINTTTFSGTSGQLIGTFNFDNWHLIVSVGNSTPPEIGLGTLQFPNMDLGITGNSSGGGPALTITFFGTGFGPTSGAKVNATLSGQALAGSGDTVHFNTFFSTLNDGSQTTALTSSGAVNPVGAPQNYNSTGSASPLTGNPYSLTEVVTIGGTKAAQYSLDASLTAVPDGGTTLVLLGSALSSLALLRKRFAKVA